MIKPAFIAVAGLGVLVACAVQDMPSAQDGRVLYTEYCALCHGDSGTGNGPLAEGISPPPPT